jgi:ComF family protein
VLADLARLLLDTVAPRRCAGCDAVSRDPICPDCADEIEGMFVPRPRPMARGTAFAGFEFEEPVRTILHRGKYGGDRGALRAIAALTSHRLRGSSDAIAPPQVFGRRPPRAGPPPPDAMVAVPLGARRRRQRGYNQSEILTRVLAEIRHVPVLDGLRRTRETKPQSVCDELGRRRNVDGAFAWVGSALDGVRLWLVDDVLTTGATVEAAGASLRAAGASQVDVIVVAVVP